MTVVAIALGLWTGSGPALAETPCDGPVDAVVACLGAELADARRRIERLERELAAHVRADVQRPPAGTVSRALVVVPLASGVRVHCGEVRAEGTLTVRIRDFPSGRCTIESDILGQALTTQVDISRPREVHCGADGGLLACR